jgi:16S rRNA (uracil1498-N3)-methyltransferase
MRITRIYTAQSLSSNSDLTLEPDASRHLARALRLGVGDNIVLFNGHGGEFPAAITNIDKKTVQVRTGEHSSLERESSLKLHLGIAISRGERMDWIVQKATELGLTELTPLLTENTGVKLPADRAEKKQLHWQQVAISACEQCGRNLVPTIHPLAPINSWIADTTAEHRFVLHHRAETAALSITATNLALLVGPEGGLSTSEIEAAKQSDFAALQIGPRILRTETAPLAAIAILQSHFGDMGFD